MRVLGQLGVFIFLSFFFFFNDTATTEIYTLSLHDALPICPVTGESARPAYRTARSPPATGSVRRPPAVGSRNRALCSARPHRDPASPQGPGREWFSRSASWSIP